MDAQDCPSLAELSDRLSGGQLSSVAATQDALARIETLEPMLHAFVRVTRERALADAARADAERAAGISRGPLHGVPIALKDLIDTRGIVTAAGTKVMAARVPDSDAVIMTRLAGAGTVLLGKLAMTEGAFSEHRPERPEPCNPWSREHWTGVSSSGAGVAVAAGLCFGAFGSDTGGSIRFPASACGVIGLKPSWGRISAQGVFPFAASLDCVGPIARSARDCALLFDATADAVNPAPRAASFGVAPEILASIHPEIAAAVARVADALASLGVIRRDVTLPALEPFAEGWAVTAGVEAAAVHAEMFDAAPQDYGPALRMLIELGRNPPPGAYQGLEAARRTLAAAMAALHEQADIILLPVLSVPTPTLDMLAAGASDPALVASLLRLTAPFNYTGQPSLTLPAGADSSGLPIGVQLIGPTGADERLLATGIALQQVSDWHLRRPEMARLDASPTVAS